MRARSGLVAVVALVSPLAAFAQAPRPMTVVDLINVPRLSDPQLSPDARQVVFVRSDADWQANKRVTHLWRVNADGSGLQQLTYGSEGESSPRWSPDSKTVAFLAKREDDEETQIYLLSLLGGEARPLTRHATAVSDVAWTPDGKTMLFVASEPKTEEERTRDTQKDDVYAYDENFKHRHLWRIDLETRTEARITSGDYSVLRYKLARDGTRIVFSRSVSPLFGDNDRGEVWVMDVDGTNARQLTDNRIGEGMAEVSPDNKWVLFLADANDRFESYYNDEIYLVPAEGGTARNLTAQLPYEVLEATWSKDGREIYFLANTGVRTQLFSLRIDDGKSEPLTEGDHTLGAWSYVAEPGRHVFVKDGPSDPGEVWMLAEAGEATRVTTVFDELSRRFRLPKQERVEWKGTDGVTVEGLLFYPIDYETGRRYPLVVQTHGGPASSDKFSFGSWSSYVPVLAAKGYAVLKPNYRGSTGYGDPFLRDMVGHYFKNAHLDVLAGVDHLVKIGLADPDRLVKMGWSAGGHMTNKVITFTDRFKAASSGAGAANWTSMYAQSDVRSYRTPWFGGTPWQKDAPIDLYWEHSPLKYVAKVKTPTIFIVGERDPRVPLPQSVEMYRALKSNGIPTRLYVAPREPHGFQELRHQLFKVNVELEWFDKHAMGRAYTWEKAPDAEAASGAPPVTGQP